MKVRNKVRDFEIVEMPTAGTLSLEHAQPVTFQAGWFLVIHGSKIAVMPPEQVDDEFDVPKQPKARASRAKRPLTFGVGTAITTEEKHG